MFKQLLRTLAFASVATLSLGQSAQAAKLSQDLSAESVIETIKKRGVIKVGMSTFVPWAMRDKKGELIGFEIDVATQLAKDMGVKVEFIPTAWDGIIPALLTGKFDLIVGGMSVTPQRNLTVNFTRPYSHSGIGIAANKKLANDLKWPDDYNSSKVTFSCRRGATPCTLIKERFPKATLRQFDDDAQAFQEVLNGSAHAVLASQPKPAFSVVDNADVLFAPTQENIQSGNEAIALRKGDPDALNFFSNWIMTKKADGWLKKRHNYWFKTKDWQADVAE